MTLAGRRGFPVKPVLTVQMRNFRLAIFKAEKFDNIGDSVGVRSEGRKAVIRFENTFVPV